MSVRVGTAIAARPTVVDDDGNALHCHPTFTSEDPSVLSVEEAERGSYVIGGRRVGATTLVVACDGESFALRGTAAN